MERSKMSLQRQVLDSDYRRKKRMSGRHIALDHWLEALNMSDYLHLFSQYGGVEDLIYASEAEIRNLGIKIGAHRAKIISSLRILRDKYEKGRVTGSGLFSLQRTPSTTSSAPNSPTAPYPDYQHVIASPEKLNLDLQRELAGDPLELRSRPWYHGNISRQRAEALVVNNGDFLVRDCISKPGDFVLTCRWKGTPLSFMINSIVGDCAPGNLPPVSYQFEEDAFPTIQQLILHYQQHSKPVTQVSGAILSSPVPRSMPLSYYDTKYGALVNFAAGVYATPNQSPKSSPFITPADSPGSSPEMNRRDTRWTGSQPILNVTSSEEDAHSNRKRESRSSSLDRCDSLPVINITPPNAGSGLESPHPHAKNDSLKPSISHMRAGSVPALMPDSLTNGPRKFSTLGRRKLVSASSESELTNPPPPKPSRIPSVKYKQKPTVVVRNLNLDDDDRDYSDYYQARESPSWLHGSGQPVDKEPEVMLRPTTAEPQKGRQANRVNREKLFLPAQVTQPPQNVNQSAVTPTTGQNPGQNLNSRLFPAGQQFGRMDLDNPPPSPTYQIVARSRSFQTPNSPTLDTNSNNLANKGYQTLPHKSSRLKQGKQSDADEVKGYGDYDIPRENVIDNLFGFNNIKHRTLATPPKVSLTKIVPENFQSSFLPKGHKALDQAVLLSVKSFLLGKSAKDIAIHLTEYDLNMLNVTQEKDIGLGITSGLELLTLPQGKQLRQDAIERWECLRLFTMVTLLTSQNVSERVKMLSLWVQVCFELKIVMGNLYSFSAIMSALTGTQIIRLSDTWLILRQSHTRNAYNFDTKLRPFYKSLNDGSSDLPLNNESIPYITPVCLLLERDVDSVLLEYFWEHGLDPVGSAIDVLLTHLDTARVIASHGILFRTKGQAVMSQMTQDSQLSQIACPEFHMLVMWGEKGWGARRRDRVEKLEQILTLLSHKYQVPGDDGTEV
ncbi:breast cancer anti-estrogen resistance protein 3 homolog isoform X2 [Physella acuta]|uniref:breast cancer anti-estrogen resistance protein 3 homolog isoform X2 n=1 Tax=Physella acuta TaxID=109671 RepID=UPI0027DE2E3A|nr:breast cancer anti-estrogen resistance protein 3 homolog isoform X2 [Physella acuta]